MCSRLEQRHEIPLHQVLEHRENACRKPAADELRGNVARLLQQAPAGAQQQHTARVHQQALAAPHQRKAAAGHQNDPADLLLLSQLILAGLEPQRLCRYPAAPFFPFCFHPHTPFNSFFSSVYHARHLRATHKFFNIQGGILFMKLSLIRSMTRSAVFELENGLCYRPAHPFTVQLNGETVYTACETNVFSLFSLLPGTPYTVAVQAEGETLTLDFTTEAETFFVDASRYGLVADGTTDNTGKLQAALSTCPKGGTVYVPAGRYRTSSLFMKSYTTLYLEKGAVLLGDNDRTHYPILPGVIPSENEVDEYYLTGWEGNPLDSFAGLLNITQVHDVVVTGEGTLDCDAQNGDWWINQKVKRIAWRPRAVAAVDSENICLHGITVQNSYSWTIHPIFVKHLDLLNFNINNPYNAPNTDGIDPESCEYIRIIGANIHVGDDCIAMKASKVFLGMKLKKSCEHTVIRNCLLDKGHGGIVIGSEMSGGVKDMVVTQCLMDHTDRGLRVKTRRGRGNTAVIDGLVFRNVEMRGVKAPFVINMFYFCDPDGHSPYVQCRDAMPVDEYTPKLGSLTMEDIVATDAQFAGCYFDGLPEQPIERVSMKNVTITFDPNAEAGQAAMADNRPNVKKLAIYAENVKEIDLHNVKITGYEGERLRFANVGHFEED